MSSTGRWFQILLLLCAWLFPLRAVLIASTNPPPPTADPSRWTLRSFDGRHGLSQNRVQALSRSPEGWIWCGTLRGLQRFDGHTFETLPNAEFQGPEHADITLVAAGFGDDLLVGFNYENLMLRRQGRWAAVDTSPLRRAMGPRVAVFLSQDLCVLCDSPNREWAIARIEAIPETTPRKPGPGWILQPVARFNAPADHDSTLVQGRTGQALVRRPDGTWLEVTHTAIPRPLPPAEASLLEDRHRRLQSARLGPQPWIDSGPDGLWAGSDRDGLNHLAPPSIELWTHPDFPRSRSVDAIDTAADGSVWWTLNESDFRAAMRWKDGNVVPLHGSNVFQSLLTLPDGTVLAGGEESLHRFSETSLQSEPFHIASGMKYLSKGSSGRVWIASATNVVESSDLKQWRPLVLPAHSRSRNTTWLSVLELANHNLWIGSIGYGAVHISNGNVSAHTPETGAPSNILNPVLEDPDGTVWFASTAGLIRRRNGTWFRFGPEHGLPENLVLGAVDDLHGRLWIHGHQGVAGLLRSDLEAVASGQAVSLRPFRPRGAAAWVIECNGGPPSSSRDTQGNLWFATAAGALRIPNDELVPAARPAPTVRSAASPSGTFWQEILHGHTPLVTCPQDADQMLEFTIAHPGAAEADFAPVQYRLEGIDAFWTTAPADGRIRYHRVASGSHQLRLRAAEGGATAESTLALLIPTRWHQTWTFRILATGGAVGLLGLYLQHRQTQSERALQEAYRQQANDRRWQIARDLHDGIGAGLARISILGAASHPTLAATAQRLIRDLDELIWLTDPERDGLDATVNYLLTTTERQLLGLGIELDLDIPDQFPALQVAGQARRHLIQLLHGALSNVIKHSRATRLKLRIRSTLEHLVLEIIDNGVGFDPADAQNRARSGLRAFNERTARLSGQFNCKSSQGKGTHLTFTLPLRNLRADVLEPHPHAA